MPALPQQVFDFISQPNPAVMATVRPDGRPVSVQIVYLVEDAEHILLSIAAGNSRGGRLQHLRDDPRMSLTVLNGDDWTEAVTVLGTAVEFFDDENLQSIDAMTAHYFGGPYAIRSPRTAVRIRIDEWTEHPTTVFQVQTKTDETVG
ncbi:pyridoxamine 5'-phosphate oxidase family protein [Pseudarthrobacter sp. P1]|uniref:pyridoxamine 5'-phosphate oxidase family protein n=1 Tax=Pseudarthrobacter sp. P1 TaxID=3418418 RepID=UPI003CE8A32E